MMCDDRAVVPGEGSGVAAGRVFRPGEGGVVSRRGLFGRLAGAGRVAVVSAPAGSGKTVLLRSWIGAAGGAGGGREGGGAAVVERGGGAGGTGGVGAGGGGGA